MRRVIVVEIDTEVGEIANKLFAEALRQFFGRYTQFTRLDHDRRAVRIAGAHIDAVVATKFLETHPDIGLQVLDHVPHVQ